MCWKLKLGPLQEPQVLFITEPSFWKLQSLWGHFLARAFNSVPEFKTLPHVSGLASPTQYPIGFMITVLS